MKPSKRKVIGAVLVVAAVLVAVASSFVPRTLVSGRVSGREVMGQMASLFASARYWSDGKTATVQLGSQTSHVTADQVELAGGRIVKQTGDGHLILFHDPGPALRAALTLVRSAGGLDVALHVGVHIGEVELRQNGDISGINVNLAARIAAQANGAEVLVSRTVRDVLAGSDLQFADRGEHQLKGIDGVSQLFAASDAHPEHSTI